MAKPTQSGPPRPIAPGDIVTAFSAALGAWTAAQITHLHADWKTAGVLELDWSGPEPTSVADLGEVTPLRLTHHSRKRTLSHCTYDWVLPRSYRVIGSLPLLHDEPSKRYSIGWRIGDQLARQRWWARDDTEGPYDQGTVDCSAVELNQVLADQAEPRPDVRTLRVRGIESLDCDRLVRHFPNLTELDLSGKPGLLSAAASLNRLAGLQRFHLSDLFGMVKQDRLLPRSIPALEALFLTGIPAEYAAAMRSTWRVEIPNGTHVWISGGRKPEWVAEHWDNPLRDWDGRAQISGPRFRKAVAQYKATRRAVIAAIAEGTVADRPTLLFDIGRVYGEAFNKLDGRSPFIDTEEREELFAALDHIVGEVEAANSLDLAWARESLASGVNAVRDW